MPDKEERDLKEKQRMRKILSMIMGYQIPDHLARKILAEQNGVNQDGFATDFTPLSPHF